MPKHLPPAWLTLFAHDAPSSTPPATGDAPPSAPPASQTPPPPATGDAPPAKPEDSLGDPGKAALQAERKARSDAEKLNRDLSAKVKAFEDAQKSAEQKMADDLAAAQAEATTARTELLRLQVAGRAGIPADLADLLTGTDEATMQATAERLKARLAPAGPPPPGTPQQAGTTAGGAPPGPVDYRKAPADEVDAELRKLGVNRYR